MVWNKCGALILLAGCLVQDIRSGAISVRWLALHALLAVLTVYFAGMRLAEPAAGLLPGVLLFCAAMITRERIGKGDAGLVLILGIYLGLWGCLSVLLLGCVLCVLFGGCMVLSHRLSPGRAVIFTPFLSAGYVIWCLLYGI